MSHNAKTRLKNSLCQNGPMEVTAYQAEISMSLGLRMVKQVPFGTTLVWLSFAWGVVNPPPSMQATTIYAISVSSAFAESDCPPRGSRPSRWIGHNTTNGQAKTTGQRKSRSNSEGHRPVRKNIIETMQPPT
jgi:hypothetical protein